MSLTFYTIFEVIRIKSCQSHFFCGHMDVNSYTYKYKPVEMCFITWNKQQTNTCVTHIYIHFHCITDNIYDFEDLFFSLFLYSSTTCPVIFLPVHNGFYPFIWWVAGSLHKAMEVIMEVIINSELTRHGVQYIKMYLNTNSLEGFKYKYVLNTNVFNCKYIRKNFKYFFKYFSNTFHF